MRTNGASAMHYTLKDHQGNLAATIQGNTVERLSYDAWGRRRNSVGFGYSNVTHTFDRGYTLHEHYDDFGLINMNSRCYDPVTSSFLAVDAYVQSPDNFANLDLNAQKDLIMKRLEGCGGGEKACCKGEQGGCEKKCPPPSYCPKKKERRTETFSFFVYFCRHENATFRHRIAIAACHGRLHQPHTPGTPHGHPRRAVA